MYNKLLLVLISTLLISCATKHENKYTHFEASNKAFAYAGRHERVNDSTFALISSASGVRFNAESDSVIFLLNCEGDATAYVAIELNGTYLDRFKIVKDSVNRLSIPLVLNMKNQIGLYKATEASNGNLLFYGVEAKKVEMANVESKAIIEFIGNSITCGFGADTEQTPCGTGTWYDQHNAYLAYGPLVARQLGLSYQLSSVSGIGIYRNWNDEDTDPVMGDVYFTKNLDGNNDKLWGFSGQQPEIVSICLGTNDFSDGDGIKERKSFNADKFISNYIDLVERIFEVYSTTKMTLLTSPMLSVEKNRILLSCLQEIKAHFDSNYSISIFEFEPMQPNGCDSHPNLRDHAIMAEQLVPFYANLLRK